MQELAGRLTALDPEASATLKVVSYFDTLVGHEAGVETLLRGAAVLSGCPAGFSPGQSARGLRMSPDGRPLPPGDPADWPASPAGPGTVVWLERAGTPHANDAMILERLALAVAISRSRNHPSAGLNRAVERVLDASIPEQDRATAAARLRLDPRRLVRAVARSAGDPLGPPAGPGGPARRHPSGIVSTPFGLARAEIVPAAAAVTGDGGDPARDQPARQAQAGIGTAVEPARLPQSWSAALVALRLADEHAPVVEADALGAVLLVAEAADAASQPHPDIAVLETMAADRTVLATLDALAQAGTIRAAASVLGVHHSTVQARLAAAANTLGYDPRTPSGRTRYALARTLHRLRHAPPL
jgi:PucR C-terminal helix-turn-helix domain